MQANATYQRMAGAEVSEVPDGYVIYDAANDRVHFLNNTAAIVYELCDGTKTASDIFQIIGGAYGLQDIVLSDIETCLASLEQERLVGKCL